MIEIEKMLVDLAEPAPEPEYELPRYGTPGWILVEIEVDWIKAGEERPIYRFSIGASLIDTDNSTFWITEGVGLGYWMHAYADGVSEGVWVFEDVVGTYTKGDWGHTEDDEDWEYKSVRPATFEEIAMLYGFDWWEQE